MSEPASSLEGRFHEDVGPAFGRMLLAHYDRSARDLPWRRTRDPYAIWVSEIMLQQTRVETVLPFYDRWMERFPTVEALAGADLDDVLTSWSGLGYYSRARNLHRSAGVVRERFGGRVPDTFSDLKSLPGVGDYAAGAIASIAFGRPEPAVDGNVRRVLSRLYDLEQTSPSTLRTLAQKLQHPERPGDFNQALMELGATLCTPKSPRCDACPVARFCRARANGTVHERPVPRPRARVREVSVVSFVVVDARQRTLLARRPATGLLGGMWEFPGLELGDPPSSSSLDAVGALYDGVLAPLTHQFTHLRVTYHPVVVRGPATLDVLRNRVPELDLGGRPTRVRRIDGLDGLAVPAGQLKIANRVIAAVTTRPRPGRSIPARN